MPTTVKGLACMSKIRVHLSTGGSQVFKSQYSRAIMMSLLLRSLIIDAM